MSAAIAGLLSGDDVFMNQILQRKISRASQIGGYESQSKAKLINDIFNRKDTSMLISVIPLRDPSLAAALVLQHHWNQQLPVRVDLIAQRMGVKLFPRSGMRYSGHFFSADDTQNQSGQPAIVFNTDDSSARQRFTIAHELGHYVLGHGTSPRDTSKVLDGPVGSPNERAANQFAAHLLMPADAVRMMTSQGHASTDALAKIFGVSAVAMGYRLVNLRL